MVHETNKEKNKIKLQPKPGWEDQDSTLQTKVAKVCLFKAVCYGAWPNRLLTTFLSLSLSRPCSLPRLVRVSLPSGSIHTAGLHAPFWTPAQTRLVSTISHIWSDIHNWCNVEITRRKTKDHNCLLFLVGFKYTSTNHSEVCQYKPQNITQSIKYHKILLHYDIEVNTNTILSRQRLQTPLNLIQKVQTEMNKSVTVLLLTTKQEQEHLDCEQLLPTQRTDISITCMLLLCILIYSYDL